MSRTLTSFSARIGSMSGAVSCDEVERHCSTFTLLKTCAPATTQLPSLKSTKNQTKTRKNSENSCPLHRNKFIKLIEFVYLVGMQLEMQIDVCRYTPTQWIHSTDVIMTLLLWSIDIWPLCALFLHSLLSLSRSYLSFPLPSLSVSPPPCSPHPSLPSASLSTFLHPLSYSTLHSCRNCFIIDLFVQFSLNDH